MLVEVIVEVRVDQAGIGTGDLGSTLPGDVGDNSIEVIHQLGRLNKLILVSIPQLSELVDVLCRTNF